MFPVKRPSVWIYSAFTLALITLLAWVQQDPFFWDTVQLGSKHAHFFYENGLNWKVLPPEIDSGHPPVFGYYLALCWTLFGKTLVVSHWAMGPFLLANLWLLWRLGDRLGWAWAAPLLVFSDPVILTQHALVGPDVCVLTGFLVAVDGIWRKDDRLVTAGVLLLCLISMRGMMTAAALLLWQLWRYRSEIVQTRTLRWRGFLPFIPGFASSAAFLIWHWSQSGWLGYHAASPWAGAFQKVGWSGFIRNIAIVGWRWTDFGRIGLFLFLAMAVLRGKRGWRAYFSDLIAEKNDLAALWFFTTITLSISALSYQNLSAHRYFIPAFVAFHLLILQLLARMRASAGGPTRANRLLFLLSICLVSGHLWIYPRGVSMDWDCTLAHRPYHALRREATAFLDEQGIDWKDVGTSFPCLNTGENLMLNGDHRTFSPYKQGSNRYVLCSNILNDFSRADLDTMEQYDRKIWYGHQGEVWMAVYDCQAKK